LPKNRFPGGKRPALKGRQSCEEDCSSAKEIVSGPQGLRPENCISLRCWQSSSQIGAPQRRTFGRLGNRFFANHRHLREFHVCRDLIATLIMAVRASRLSDYGLPPSRFPQAVWTGALWASSCCRHRRLDGATTPTRGGMGSLPVTSSSTAVWAMVF